MALSKQEQDAEDKRIAAIAAKAAAEAARVPLPEPPRCEDPRVLALQTYVNGLVAKQAGGASVAELAQIADQLRNITRKD